MASILVDTGILYAIADRDDTWYESAKIFLQNNADALIAPATVVPEACYLLNSYLGQEAEQSFITSITRGELRVEGLLNKDFLRSLELLRTYASANIGFVDASIIALAERLNIRRLLTTDRRHFSFIRPRHCPAFILLP
jgi:predicted nucleic acid-binding protein